MKFLLLLILTLPVFAQELVYLTPESVNLKSVPVPPSAGSYEDLEDLETVFQFQNTRSSEDCKRASVEAQGFATSFYGEPYGPLTMDQAQRLIDFQETLFQEVKYFSRILKQRHGRLRPFLRDANIKPCIPLERSLSYPSGHAAIAIVSARTFSLIYPEHETTFIKRAQVIAEDRVVGGVHYPSDVEAGKELGEIVFQALLRNKKFVSDVKKLSP